MSSVMSIFLSKLRHSQQILKFKPTESFSGIVSRNYSRWQKKYLKALYNRRQEIGPEKERHRSAWINWNYNAEIFAFGQRLGEKFNESTLRRAFTHRCYIEQEEQKREDLGLEEEKVPLSLQDNEDLVRAGGSLCSEYIKRYLRHSLPSLPEEGVLAIHNHLVTDKLMAYVGRHLGISDLILSKDLTVDEPITSKTFKAVIGALSEDQGQQRAELFIQDFLLTQLIGKDINDMWEIVNPMGALTDILTRQDRGLPEPRLLRQSGSETMVAVFVVGIYSDKKLLGQSPGETVEIAEELAARDALNNMFRTSEYRTPFKFGKDGHTLEIDGRQENESLRDYVGRHLH